MPAFVLKCRQHQPNTSFQIWIGPVTNYVRVAEQPTSFKFSGSIQKVLSDDFAENFSWNISAQKSSIKEQAIGLFIIEECA